MVPALLAAALACAFVASSSGAVQLPRMQSGMPQLYSCATPGSFCEPCAGNLCGPRNYTGADCEGACPVHTAACTTDWDCSLAGECTGGKCACDPWATGPDCSKVNLLPVDKQRMGYIDPVSTSWGGNAVRGSDNKWHLYMAEINCDGKPHCGLGTWQTNSQVAHATSDHVDGPYTREGLVLPKEHHNPTVQVSPVDGSWNLYSISSGSGPIVVATSRNQASGPWKVAASPVSPEQNPGAFMLANGSVWMYYRDDAASAGPCSQESVGLAICPNGTAKCVNLKNPLFNHTAEDPSVFRDHRGNFHMLINAGPYKCTPKAAVGGHAWSRDGLTWSEPTLGAYTTTIAYLDGTRETCVRRERPQMVLDATARPLAMFTGVMDCINGTFTLAQRVGNPAWDP